MLTEIRHNLEKIHDESFASNNSRPAFHLFLGVADTANNHQKLHPWRQVVRELLGADM